MTEVAPTKIALLDDDQFEEFEREWNDNQEDEEDLGMWEDDWEDDDLDDDFLNQLRKELDDAPSKMES